MGGFRRRPTAGNYGPEERLAPLDASDTDWQINSVGWISGQGRNYLMAVLTTGNPTEQYGIDTIDQLAAIVWKDMNLAIRRISSELIPLISGQAVLSRHRVP